jgi:hypothetical protein
MRERPFGVLCILVGLLAAATSIAGLIRGEVYFLMRTISESDSR